MENEKPKESKTLFLEFFCDTFSSQYAEQNTTGTKFRLKMKKGENKNK